VTLETAATETGLKDFVAVGTTIDRGEDLAAKGAVSVFVGFMLDWVSALDLNWDRRLSLEYHPFRLRV